MVVKLRYMQDYNYQQILFPEKKMEKENILERKDDVGFA